MINYFPKEYVNYGDVLKLFDLCLVQNLCLVLQALSIDLNQQGLQKDKDIENKYL